jgi:formylglycine-generating enzyme required for sulfatase activity
MPRYFVAASVCLSAVFALVSVTLVMTSAAPAAPGTKFRDCPECPEMVVVPAGDYLMGSANSEVGHVANEGPVHKVSVPTFAVGIYPITRAEFSIFVRESGHPPINGCTVWTGRPFGEQGFARTDAGKNWRNPGFQQTDNDPAVCISWEDAQAYVRWLNGKAHGTHRDGPVAASTGPYRLLSEAEWEYAARGGTNTPYYWGSKISHQNANYGLEKCPPCGPLAKDTDLWNNTSPVGSFPPNHFGIYDMSGNVFQYVEDCWHDNYVGAPSDGTAWVTGNCKFRVDRGGDWIDDPKILRVAYRDMGAAGDRDQFTGFRVARNLDHR